MRRERSADGPQSKHVLGLALFGLSLAASPPAEARLSQQQLADVAVLPPDRARVPGDLRFADAIGARSVSLGEALDRRPAVLLPVDYTCGNVCDPMLSMTAAALKATGLAAGSDYTFVLVGLDARDDAGAARRMVKEADLTSLPQLMALLGNDAAIQALTRSLGYGFVYDAGTDSFAHPAAALLLTPDGHLARVLAPLALNARDLRLALVEAGEGRIGTFRDRFALLCYGFDAAKGIYTPLIERILGVAAALTILAIGLGVLLLKRLETDA